MKRKDLYYTLMFALIIFLKSVFLLFNFYGFSGGTIFFGFLCLPSVCFMISFSLPMETSGRLKYLIILNIVFSVIFFLDLMYFKGVDRLFSIYVLYLKNITFDMTSPAASKLSLSNYVILADMPFMIFLILKNYRCRQIEPRSNLKKIFPAVFIVSLTLMLSQYFYAVQTGKIRNYENHALILSPIGNHIYNTGLYISEKTTSLNEEKENDIREWFAQNRPNLDASGEFEHLHGILKDKNLIIIHFESLESFVIGKKYHGRVITPVLNELIDKSIYFSSIYEQIGEGVSADCELMFNTGLYPKSKGCAFMSYGNNEYFSLPRLLRENGYATMAVHGDIDTFWNRDIVYPNFGIDKYVHEELFRTKIFSGLGILDQYLFEEAVIEARKVDSPFYSYVMTVTSHTPFNLEDEFALLDIPGDDHDIGYLKSIHYTDHYLGEFLKALKKEPFYEDTAIILFGDHEGIHKYHDSNFENNNGLLPFLIYLPGMEAFKIKSIGGQVDMLPTLLYLMGVDREIYENKVMGRNLLRNDEGYAIRPNGEILGNPSDSLHLTDALYITDLIFSSDYFARIAAHKNKYTENSSMSKDNTAVK